MAVLPRIVKGLLYGTVIGIFMGLAIYLLTGSVVSLGFITVSPTLLGGLTFTSCIVAGVGMEYANWIDEQEKEAAKKP